MSTETPSENSEDVKNSKKSVKPPVTPKNITIRTGDNKIMKISDELKEISPIITMHISKNQDKHLEILKATEISVNQLVEFYKNYKKLNKEQKKIITNPDAFLGDGKKIKGDSTLIKIYNNYTTIDQDNFYVLLATAWELRIVQLTNILSHIAADRIRKMDPDNLEKQFI